MICDVIGRISSRRRQHRGRLQRGVHVSAVAFLLDVWEPRFTRRLALRSPPLLPPPPYPRRAPATPSPCPGLIPASPLSLHATASPPPPRPLWHPRPAPLAPSALVRRGLTPGGRIVPSRHGRFEKSRRRGEQWSVNSVYSVVWKCVRVWTVNNLGMNVCVNDQKIIQETEQQEGKVKRTLNKNLNLRLLAKVPASSIG